VDKAALEQLSPPAIVWVDGNHYVALLSVTGERATIHDPNQPTEEVIPIQELLQRSGGVLLTLSR
jgi:ABC-type bacteriocin/lantibiotic exporter with double-glycine peptidase domain